MKEFEEKTKNIYIVTRNGEVIPELTANSEREAFQALGRWLLPYDIAFDGMTLTEVGRQAANGVNPFRVQRADLSW